PLNGDETFAAQGNQRAVTAEIAQRLLISPMAADCLVGHVEDVAGEPVDAAGCRLQDLGQPVDDGLDETGKDLLRARAAAARLAGPVREHGEGARLLVAHGDESRALEDKGDGRDV